MRRNKKWVKAALLCIIPVLALCALGALVLGLNFFFPGIRFHYALKRIEIKRDGTISVAGRTIAEYQSKPSQPWLWNSYVRSRGDEDSGTWLYAELSTREDEVNSRFINDQYQQSLRDLKALSPIDPIPFVYGDPAGGEERGFFIQGKDAFLAAMWFKGEDDEGVRVSAGPRLFSEYQKHREMRWRTLLGDDDGTTSSSR